MLLLITLFAPAALVSAQFQMPVNQPRFILLMNPKVREHLKVGAEQYKMISDALGDSVQEDGTGRIMIRLTGNDDMADLDKSAVKCLDTKQAARFEQLYLQKSGLLALDDEAVAKRLTVTEDQSEEITKIIDDYRQKLTDLFMDSHGGSSEQVQIDTKKLKELQYVAEKKIDVLLTDDQRKQWKSMLGEKFDFGEEDGDTRSV